VFEASEASACATTSAITLARTAVVALTGRAVSVVFHALVSLEPDFHKTAASPAERPAAAGPETQVVAPESLDVSMAIPV
jgi:hypothetical protein